LLLNYDYIQVMLLVLTYMVIYNVTSFLLFFTLMQAVTTDVKTLFSLSNFGASNILTKLLSLAILSLAGVPPLLGFFSKIFVFVLISNSALFVLFPTFFVLLFIGLYFYTQNLRFLNATNSPSLVLMSELSLRIHPLFFSSALPIAFLIIFGFCYVDDVFIILSWILL
jgi:NADH:ubiquinone oxidoreductase subunit 2 (subunit N)